MERKELLEYRTPTTKHFLKRDGTIDVEIYDENIHYLKNGKYEEIDNTLLVTENGYANNKSNFKVNFNAEKNDEIIKISNKNKTLSMSFKDSSSFSLFKKKEVKSKLNKSKISDKVKYKNVYKNIDVEYEVNSNKIKESIILKKLPNKDSFSFVIKTDLDLKLNKDNTISCKSKGKEKFKIAKPYMIDSNNEISQSIAYNLEKNDDGYEITIIPDKEWLHDSSRVYPVIIDPTITGVENDKSVIDTYIYQGDTNDSVYNTDILKVGVDNVNNKTIAYRSLLKFDLPKIPASYTMIKATLNLVGYPDSTYDMFNSNTLVSIHKVTKDWTESNAKWNNMANMYDSKIESYFTSTRSYLNGTTVDPKYSIADITGLVQEWYNNPSSNYGLMLKAFEETYNANVKCGYYFSKDSQTTGDNPKPRLVISYRNLNGLENYMSYTSKKHALGYSHINNFNGNLTCTFNVANTIGGPLPANLYLVYNTTDIVSDNKGLYGCGQGIKPNLIQTVEKENIEITEMLKYLDEDGTIHYFYKKDNIYQDEDGLGLTIELINNNYIMKDKNLNTNKFIKHSDGKYYLEQITDTNNKSIKIIYDINNRITKVIDASNKEINITYTTNKVSFISPYKTVNVNLTSNKITSIENLSDTTIVSYNTSDLIEKITNSSGLSTKYEYINDLIYKVSKVTEYSTNGNEGNYLEFAYNVKSTSVKDRKGHINTYVFNNRGNVETISNLDKNNDFSNVYGQANTYGEDDTSSVNKLVLSNTMIKPVINLINHSSFESSIEETQIFFESDNNNNISCELDNDAHYGTANEKITSLVANSEVYKNVSVLKDSQYTFSLYLKNDIPLELSLSYDEKKETLNISELNSEYKRYYLTINYASNASSDLKISLKSLGIGTIKVDDIQLEKGEVANLFNLIENSSFTYGTSGFDVTSMKRTGIQWNYETEDIDPSVEVVEIGNNVKALKIINSPLKQTTLATISNISGMAGDVFELSFWYKNESIEIIPDGETTFDPCFASANLVFEYTDDDSDFDEPPYLKPINSDWHYFSKKFIAKKDYSNIAFNLIDMFTTNNLYITNICLFKDLENYSYVYDDEGNLISSVDLAKETSKFAYNSNNQLIQATTPRGANYKYEYDDNITDRLVRAISPSGITNAVDYDENNNPIKMVINNTQAFDDIINTIYYIRARGTDDYLYINEDKTLKIKQCECSHDRFNVLLQQNGKIKIQYSVMPNYYLKDNNGALKVEYGDNNNIFELIKHSNKSYSIKSESSNLAITTKTDKTLTLDTYSETNTNQQFLFERIESKIFIESSAKYTEDGRFIKSIKDALGNSIIYDINSTTCLINSITDPNGSKTNYIYDNKFRITNISKGNQKVMYEYDSHNNLSKIKHGTKNYIFEYDEFNNMSDVKINNTILLNNTYENNNGNVTKIKYGNGHEINYSYDEFDRVKKITKANDTYINVYDNLGRISKIIANNENHKYEYDFADRISKYEFNNYETSYDYGEGNVISKKIEKLGLNKYTYSYTYNLESALTSLNILNNNFNYLYDNLGRIAETNINDIYKTKYHYITRGNKTSLLIDKINDNGLDYTYTYDKLENLIEVRKSNNITHKYYYDEYSQLIKEEDLILKQTKEYTYDNYGNIISKKVYENLSNTLTKEDKYEYNDANWQDLLTKYNNESITYDKIGNPLTMGIKNFEWINGRELSEYSDDKYQISFEYNLDGIRTSKTVNGTKIKYYLENQMIIFEDRNGDIIYYIYNGDELLGFVYKNNIYYYHKNIFGDIMGILDSNYNEVVKYSYDSWGALDNITDNSNINLGTINPFRYRSYYYDEETKLYYLGTRYYNPSIGRFINADCTVSTGQEYNGHNMFNYCGNNPIARADNDGKVWLKLAASVGIVTGMVGLASSVAETIVTDPNASLRECLVNAFDGFVSGFVSGFVAAAPLNKIGKGARIATDIGLAFFDAAASSYASQQFDPLDFTADVISTIVTNKFYEEVIPTPIRGAISPKVSSKRGTAAIVNTGVNSVVDSFTSVVYEKYQKVTQKKITAKSKYKPTITKEQFFKMSKIKKSPRLKSPLLKIPKQKRMCYL